MNKTRIVLLVWLLCICSAFTAYANPPAPPKSKQVNVQVAYAKDVITITNQTDQSVSLRNAILQFYYSGNVSEIIGLNSIKANPQIKVTSFAKLPNNQGNLYQINLTDITPSTLAPKQKIQLKVVKSDKKASQPHGFQLSATPLVPVQVQVTVAAPNWTQTIQICNTSPYPIPLTDIEFDFNYAASMSNSIWGQPWLSWQLTSQQGSQVVLVGGNPWSSSLQPDPTCANPISIQFSSTPQSAAPTGPFTFLAAGGVPIGSGAMTVTLSAAPTTGLANPQITVQGPSGTMQQVVAWGQPWQLTNLVPGTYTVSATPEDNGQQYYQLAPFNVAVQNQVTATATVTYQQVPTGSVGITLTGAPGTQEAITLTGAHYVFNQTVSTGSTLQLPMDSYTVTSNVTGYSALANPNPLVVPNNSNLTITYQKASGSRYVGYFESWSPDYQTNGAQSQLANLPSYVNVVNLAFMRPDAIYQKGSLNYAGTGLEFNYANGTVLKQAIAALHQNQPNTKILVSVGGADYTNWTALNVQAITDFVTDFGLDGVDIDYEPASAGCAMGSDNLIHCQVDTVYQSYINLIRAALPRPYWLTVAAWSTGAFGEGQWVNAQPQDDFTGVMLPVFRSSAGSAIDMVNVMSYDAGTTYNPEQALAAYSNYFTGPIAMGVEVPPESWGGHVYTIDQVNQLAQAEMASAPAHQTPPGMMIWALHSVPNGTATADNPNAQMMSTAICTDLGLTNCNQPLFN